jgi:phage-related protein
MPVIASNCHELRIVDRLATWRVIYVLEADAVVILEVFSKKTATTPSHVLETCKRRLKAYRKHD